MSQEDFNHLEDAWNAKHKELYEALQRKAIAVIEVHRLEREVTELARRLDLATWGARD